MPLPSNEMVPLIASSPCGAERCRIRPSAMRALPENCGLASGPLTCAEQRRRAAAAHVAEEPLEDAEVRLAGRFDRDDAVVQLHLPAHLQLGAVAGDAQPADLEHVPVERQLDRPVVGERVVEQLEVQLFDARADQQAIDVGELADRHARCRWRRRS